MKYSINVAVLTKYFLHWSGGIDFLRNCANALLLQGEAVKLHLLFPEKTVRGKLADLLLPYKRRMDRMIRPRKPQDYRTKPIAENVLMDALIQGTGNLFAVTYRDDLDGLLECLDGISADVLLPLAESPGVSFAYPWLGYIPDLQHKILPDFFSEEECATRDTLFSGLLRDAKGVIVNSRAVQSDVTRFYPESQSRLFPLPFSPVPLPSWFDDDPSVYKRRYGLPDRYFLISNQFWVHKSHMTAFEALSSIRKIDPASDAHVVCTGATGDYRFPDYIDDVRSQIKKMNLSDFIHFLGYIPKNDQLQIMRGSIAVLQPTLCEGGPGGGAVYEAVALGIPVLSSDIPVNQEIEGENVFFFRAGSADDMAEKMAKLLRNTINRPSRESLLEQGYQRADRLGNSLLEAIAFGISSLSAR